MQLQRRSRAITPEAQQWIWGLRSHTPRDFGYTPDTWNVTLLVVHVRGYCRAAGHPTLAGLTYGGLSKLLACGPDVGRLGA